ncbi:MAG: HNH endonuclease, partial [Moorea sp. SIO3I7]|nr:HNH endonuclease [Moorena sp. SIO3I7]
MRVFVLDQNKQPLDPCHPARARKLLKKGMAQVFKRYPFTIILQTRAVEDSVTHPHSLS